MSSTPSSGPMIDEILGVPSRIYPFPGRYRLRLFCGPAGDVLLLTDLGVENPGASVTNAAAEVLAFACARFELDTSSLTIIEHYDRRRHDDGHLESSAGTETFAEIVGSLAGLTRANAPYTALHWRPLTKATVETWIGSALQ